MSSTQESRAIARVFMGTSVALLFLDVFINYRLWSQTNRIYSIDGFTGEIISSLVKAVIVMFSFVGVEWALLLLKVVLLLTFCVYIFIGRPSVADERPGRLTYIFALVSPLAFLLLFFFSPFYFSVGSKQYTNEAAVASIGASVGLYALVSYSLGRVGRWIVYGGADGMKATMEDDPFGQDERRFNQTEVKLENKYSVNIPYLFTNVKDVVTKGWLNFINPFRGIMVIGTPGSGKSFTFFLAAIEQMVSKGYTMLVYDFKYKELSEYTYNCYIKSLDKIRTIMNGIVPTFHVISFDNIFESDRCNVLQKELLEDFTIDAYGASNIFLTALNRSWSTKEGDFFPESAKNITAAGIWALKIYKGGRYCTLPHLIEFYRCR